jgi:hypothetical protein
MKAVLLILFESVISYFNICKPITMAAPEGLA